MHVRKRLTMCLVTLAIFFFVLGFAAGLLSDVAKKEEKDGYSSYYILAPSSEDWKNVATRQSSSVLRIDLNSTDRLLTTISLNGEVEYTKNESFLENAFLLRQVGNWNVTFKNYNADYVNYTLTLTLTTYIKNTVYPFAWLIFPTFAAGQFTLCLIIIVAFYDNMKKWSRKTKEIILLSAVAILALGSMPLLSLVTGTDTPIISPISSSMEPTINAGDLALVQGAHPRSLEVGDILVYDKLVEDLSEPNPRQISAPTVHRIERIVTYNNKRFFVTRGDNNPNEDSWFVPEEGVMGKVTFVVPYLGGVVLALGQIEAKIVIISVAIGAIALWPNKKTEKNKTKLGVKEHEEKILPNR